jgi:hypothetical protein
MRFADAGATGTIGWESFSADGDADRFQDEGRGTAMLVTIDAPGAPPIIETVEVGRLRWCTEERDLTQQRIGEIISTFGDREQCELTILRLRLTGVVDPEKFGRLDSLAEIICNRYHPGSTLDTDGVLIEPSAEQLTKLVGDGVLARVLGRLRTETLSSEPRTKRVAEHALKLLYRMAWEAQAP